MLQVYKVRQNSKREMKIVSILTSECSNSEAVVSLIRTIIPLLQVRENFIGTGVEAEDDGFEVLNILTKCSKHLNTETSFGLSTWQLAMRTIALNFGVVSSSKTRLELSHTYLELNNCRSSGRNETSASILVELNALNDKNIDEIDYDKRLAAYKAVDENAFITVHGTTAILCQCCFDILSEDIVLRTAASDTMSRLIKSYNQMERESQESFLTGVSSVFKNSLMNSLQHSSTASFREFVQILAIASEYLPDLFPDIGVLRTPHDEETDFFNNICHMQKHRRVKAINRLGQVRAIDHVL